MDIEDIKKEVLNRIKGIQKYKRIPEKQIIQWINEIPATDFNPYTITEDKEEADEKEPVTLDDGIDAKVVSLYFFTSTFFGDGS